MLEIDEADPGFPDRAEPDESVQRRRSRPDPDCHPAGAPVDVRLLLRYSIFAHPEFRQLRHCGYRVSSADGRPAERGKQHFINFPFSQNQTKKYQA